MSPPESIDANNDKVVDSLGESVDRDGDGIADLYDLDGDGNPDGIGVDRDRDGYADAVGIDTDNDGIIDALDVTGDGVADVTTDDNGNASTPSGGASGTGGTGSGGTGPATGGTGPGTGGTGSSGTGGSPTGSLDCAGADIFCADFENASAGTVPTGTPWLPSTCGNASAMPQVTAGSGRNGSQGLVSTMADGSGTCSLFADLSAQTNFWVTAWIKITDPNIDMQHEVTFFELGEKVDGNDPELRIGYRGDSSCGINGAPHQGFELGATAGPNGEYTGCTGNKPVADEWYCMEVEIDQSGADMISHLYVDNQLQTTHVHSTEQPDIIGLFDANYLKVGMQTYSGTFQSLAIDDVSVSTTRIPCPSK